MRKKVIRVVASPVSLDLFLGEQMAYLSQWYDVIGVASPGAGHDRVRSRGVRTKEINIERPIRPWKDLKSLWNLFRFFRKEKPWMVHSITPKAGLLSMTAAWMAGVPVRIHTFTGLLFPWKKGILKWVLKTTDRLTCLFATHVNPEGLGVKKQLEDGRITRKYMIVLGNGHLNGVDLDRFSSHGKRNEMRSMIRADDTSVVFAFTGRLVKDKGIVELQEAFRSLLNQYANVYLLLIGEEEPDLDPLPHVCMEWLTSCPHVYLTGQVDNVSDWLEAADIFVFPSYREGFPSALLEAAAMRLPIIASNICGIGDIIEEGKNGMLVSPQDTDSLLEMLRFCMEHRKMMVSLGARAREDVVNYWDCRLVRKNLVHFYKSLEKKQMA